MENFGIKNSQEEERENPTEDLSQEMIQKEETIELSLSIDDLKKMAKVVDQNHEKMKEGNAGKLYLEKNKFALELKKEYGEDVYKCALYYVLIDGTIGDAASDNIEFLDFEGDDSIKDFINYIQ